MKHTRLVAMVLVLCMVICLLPARVSAVEIASGDCGQKDSNVTWTLDSNGTMTISGTGKIMDFWLEYNVETDIWETAGPWSDRMDEITSVIISEGITYIGDYNFDRADNLRSVKIANSVTEIGDWSFRDCDSLTSISFGNGLKKTGIEVFSYCDILASVTLANADTEYGNSFFLNCPKLSSITFPSKMRSIGIFMFEGCESLTSVTIPDTITSIGGGAFNECYNLKSVKLPSTLQVLESKLFQQCTSLTNIEIPKSVTEIGPSAFEFCTSLSAITLPEGLLSLGDNAFYHCESLTDITIPNRISFLGSNTFAYCTALKTVKFTGNAPSMPNNDVFWDVTATVYYPESNPSWTKDVMKNYSGNLTWKPYSAPFDPNGIYASGTLGGNLTWKLTNDYTLTISGNGQMPDRVTCPWKEFRNNVKKIIIENGVTGIGFGSFEEHENLQSISIPNTVTRIGQSSFSDCTSLKEITLPGSVTVIGPYTFERCTALSKVTIGNKVSEIGRDAFSGCTSLKAIKLPTSLTTISQSTFYNSGLESIEIPESITVIEADAFNGTPLTEITFRGDAPSIHYSTFYGVTATVYYPEPNNTWTEDVKQNYYGNLTWVPYHSHDYSYSGPVFSPDSKTHLLTCACGLSKAEACTFAEEILEEATLETFGMKRYTCTVCGGTYEGHYVYRIAGENRFETAFKVADQMKENLGIEKFDSVIIASGANFADALSGSYLASVKNAPILLSYKAAQNEQVQAYIKANLAEGGTVYILGGTSAVPADMESGLAGINVVRLDGANRFETNLMILKEAGVREGQEILVCTSTNFADSLSASATGLPILLVYNEKSKLTDDQLTYLGSLSGNSFRIIGGENAVSSTLEAAIAAYGPVNRLAGANRFATSVMVAETYFDAPEYAVLAYAWNYPDGLCGGPLAYTMDAPLVLTMTKYEATAAEYIEESGIERGIVLGGTGLISDDAVRTIFPNISKPQ